MPGALPHLTGGGVRGKAPPFSSVKGELDGKTCSPTPLTVISSGTFPLR